MLIKKSHFTRKWDEAAFNGHEQYNDPIVEVFKTPCNKRNAFHFLCIKEFYMNFLRNVRFSVNFHLIQAFKSHTGIRFRSRKKLKV